MADVNDLLARLKSPSASGSADAPSTLHHPQPQPAAALYRQSFTSPAPPGESHTQTAPAFVSSNRPASFNVQSDAGAASDRTNNLLNLLKFNRPSASPSLPSQPPAAPLDSAHARLPSSSESPIPLSTRDPPSNSQADAKPTPPENPLLKLLNRSQAASSQSSAVQSPPSLPPKIEADSSTATDTPAAPQQLLSHRKAPVFTYVNPFEQLASSSPMNKKKNLPQLSDSNDASKNSSSPAPSPLPDGRSRVEALMGIGAEPPKTETVSEALDQIGQQADKDASNAVARAQDEGLTELESITKVVSEMEQADPVDTREAVQEAATELKQELKDPASQDTLRHLMSKSAAAAFEDTVQRVAMQGQTREPETAIADETVQPKGPPAEPQVFQFPMRPFVAIDISADVEPMSMIRDDLLIKIASLKREFDQVDRTLASATTNHIVYAMLNQKGGGFRVIRQDEGTSKHVFKKTGNSIFNLSISSSKNEGPEPVLATDVNGAVCWTSIPLSDPEQFAQEDLESRGLIFPPLPSQDDNTSGAQLKTRAKLSSRHPEFFAVGRGKSIHIIRPDIVLNSEAAYINSESRIVDSEKYLNQQCLKIATGKAGKDFTFSEDDTLIASLDKAGRLKFWDIRAHVDLKTAQFKAGTYRHIEVKIPLMTLATCAPTEKSWATSVQFIDKERPTVKGSALRYMLVGSKQNHTLHLWDLGLGKPVQEVNFPHGNELDAICSVVYHAKSGILAVGHPTRNSIFFIHISAPRYNLSPNLSQAEYIKRLAEKDSTLPKPESTAIMSGMREVSLSKIGQLRSLDINPVPLTTSDQDAIMELYIMHSNGATCFTLTRQEVGAKRDGKPIHPVDAISANRISLGEFKPPPVPEDGQPSESGSKAEEPWKKENKEPSKDAKTAMAQALPKAKASVSPPKSPLPQPTTSAASQTASKMKEAQPAEVTGKVTSSREVPAAPVSFAQMAQRAVPEGRTVSAAVTDTSNSTSKPLVAREAPVDSRDEELGTKLGESISNAVSKSLNVVLGDQLENLYRRLDEDKRVQEAAGAAKQDAVLRLVSSTLTDNVEKSLTRIITTNIQEFVLPSIANTTSTMLDRKVSDALTHQLQSTMPRELKSALQPVVSKAIQSPEALGAISDLVANKVTAHVEQVFSATLQNSIAPAFKKMSVEAAQKMTSEVQREVGQQLQQFDMQRQNDGAKIDQLTAMTLELLGTVKTLTNGQTTLQNEIAKLQAEIAQSSQGPAETSRPTAPTAASAPRDAELDEITTLMTTGRFEEGTIKWLQSARQAELFDKLFIQLSPSYLRSCNQIVTLSVSAAVTSSFNTHITERLSWLEVALSSINPQDPEITDHAPGVMDHLTQRLQEVYMQIAEEKPSDPILGKIHTLVREAKAMKLMMTR